MGPIGEERRTLVLVNLAGIMERADEALLPAVYKEVGAALHTTPTGLGFLTLFRSLVQASCYPLAAYLAVRYNRAHVIALGSFLWAAATVLVALSDTFLQVAISRALNGIGLAIVTPAIQSLVADSTDDSTRGSAFGWLHLTGMIGSVLGGLFSLLLAPHSFMGIAGWRVAFHLVGVPVWMEVKGLIQEAKAVVKIPSFQIIVAQGVTGSFPWSALSFTPMWLELIGFSHGRTGLLMGMFMVGTSLGGLLGGKIGDFLAINFPNSGRIVSSQISSGSAVPLAAVLMLVLPANPSTGLARSIVLLVMGLSLTWNGPATNGPIFAEIVPEKSRTSIYALSRFFESILSSFASPVVGILAEYVYGYKPPGEGTSVETDKENAASLAKALCTAIAIPMSLCCFIYSFLYHTYPRDRGRVRMGSLKASEMEKNELENYGLVGHHSRIQRSRSELNDRERKVTHVFYGDQDFETDDDDNDDNAEKMLLSHQVGISNES
ncbi:uncharacterized protein LOC103707906 isoform X2 [Phoenix dactylifera]|uniref:Uncharacterized protein LOC103707906 isoform X2 n=1 Tax=Phoenix dactylifera TaxID=42345 RepID=A0A8B8J4V6_PHODC|nr:uncharacterized protein LOC103707906 isoform X2 [Phoenix dactylifera]